MTQKQRADFMIRYLLDERKEYQDIPLPSGLAEKQQLLRGLMNIRPPVPVPKEFLSVQDAYLEERLAERGVTSLKDLTPVRSGLYLWQGDITTLAVDAIVNAANSQVLGCFILATAALTTRSTPMRGYSSVWSAPVSWRDKKKRNLPARPRSRKPTICPAAMCCTPSAPSSMAPLPTQTGTC